MWLRCLPLLLAFVTTFARADAPRTLEDMAGDKVAVPARVERVVTVGSVPVLNGLVFAVGEGRRIANGLPEFFARKPRWGYQAVFAPQTARLPPLQNADRTPNLESLLAAAPDAVLTMDRAGADVMRRAGLPALYLAWRQPEDVKTAVRLLGRLLDVPQAAERYAERFDRMLASVSTRLRDVRTRPRVLYFSPKTLTQPHLVAEWWIRAAGGESVTDDGREIESRSFTLEQLLAWNPDILIVSGHEEAEAVRREPRFAGLAAVRANRILIAPCGAHLWGNRTAEQPLTVLWAAKHFHPAVFADVDLVAETQTFYRDIFGTSLSVAQVREILDGGPRAVPLPH